MARLDFGATVIQPIFWGAAACALANAVIVGEAILSGATPQVHFLGLLALAVLVALCARVSQSRVRARY
jgi:hypothetical protein